eukprot:1151813-Pelagomonas_calceolata.AAC.5
MDPLLSSFGVGSGALLNWCSACVVLSLDSNCPAQKQDRCIWMCFFQPQVVLGGSVKARGQRGVPRQQPLPHAGLAAPIRRTGPTNAAKQRQVCVCARACVCRFAL